MGIKSLLQFLLALYIYSIHKCSVNNYRKASVMMAVSNTADMKVILKRLTLMRVAGSAKTVGPSTQITYTMIPIN